MKNYCSFFSGLKTLSLLAFISIMFIQSSQAQPSSADLPSKTSYTKEEQTVLNLSKQKWQWMSARDTNNLEALFHEKAVFVHMGATMTKQQEIDVIRSGGIHYKKADIHEASVNIIGTTAICINRITLLAIVGGNEVTNPFSVTEVYVQEDNRWKLASLSFTKLLTQ